VNQEHLNIYWDSNFINILETWGEENAWREIVLLMAGRSGRVLDIACGTGIVMEKLIKTTNLKLYGCDISDLLISKAIEKGISKDRLCVIDAKNTDYDDGFFEHSYSIGSLEHFVEEDLEKAIAECRRITKEISFHMVPISKNEKDEGWIITKNQSYHNNTTEWWLSKFSLSYNNIYCIDSLWSDYMSRGKWFICNPN
jgi:ubiquinone/menaquinone biosynthesis C-methylase UbiE